jgi:hypothetical protein
MNKYYNLVLTRAQLPRLTLATRVIDKIVANAMIYPTETGELLVGLAVDVPGRAEPDMYVLDTVPPDESAVRRGAYFEQGDDVQGEIFNWYADNWEQFRERRRHSYGNALGAKWDVPLANVGDWHKHPGTLTHPSGGDFDTAFEHVFDSEKGVPQILVILATVWDRTEAEADTSMDPDELIGVTDHTKESDRPRPLKIHINDVTTVRIDFWYMSRRTRRFVRLAPIITEDALLPNLPAISWHVSDPARLRQEVEGLIEDGYKVLRVQSYNADNVPPLEICLQVFRMTGKQVFTIVTKADFPASRPVVRASPIESIPEDTKQIFQPIWGQSQPVPEACYPTAWTATSTLVGLVRAVEAGLAAQPAKAAAPASTATTT